MCKPLLRLDSLAAVLGAAVVAVAFISTGQALERRPALAFPEVDQPAAVAPCAANCPAGRLNQPGAGGVISAGPGTTTGGGSSSGGSSSGGSSSGGSSSGGSSSGGIGGIGGGLGGIGGIGGGGSGGLGGDLGGSTDTDGLDAGGLDPSDGISGKGKGKSKS